MRFHSPFVRPRRLVTPHKASGLGGRRPPAGNFLHHRAIVDSAPFFTARTRPCESCSWQASLSWHCQSSPHESQSRKTIAVRAFLTFGAGYLYSPFAMIFARKRPTDAFGAILAALWRLCRSADGLLAVCPTGIVAYGFMPHPWRP